MSYDPLKTFTDALDAHGCAWRGHPWKGVAQCPAHEDRSPSLTFAEGVDGRVVLHCWAGCSTEDVIRALGLDWRDLFPPGSRHAPKSRRPRLVTESAIDSAERVLAAAGFTWKMTADPSLFIVNECPACEASDLWLYHDGKRLRASCWMRGCTSSEILAALRDAITPEEVRHAAA